jgi:hypothetical protein
MEWGVGGLARPMIGAIMRALSNLRATVAPIPRPPIDYPTGRS